MPEPATAVVVALCGAGIAALARRPRAVTRRRGVRKPSRGSGEESMPDGPAPRIP